MTEYEMFNNEIRYEPDTGLFYWKRQNKTGKRRLDKPAGFNRSNGYLAVSVDGYSIFLQVLAFLLTMKKRPDHQMDHINGDKKDNRWCNLRPATNEENSQNRARSSRNKSGYTGVHKRGNKFQAYICSKSKLIHLGFFDTAEEAHKAYIDAKQYYHTFNPTTRNI